MDPSRLDLVKRRADQQDGVLTVAQLRALGVSADAVGRRVARGEWQRAFTGVVVVHSGEVPWRTWARAALLRAGAGAHLSHAAAGFVLGYVLRPPRVLDVSVPESRRLTPTPRSTLAAAPTVRLHRRRRLDGEVVARFPVTSPGTTALDLVAAARSDDDAVGLICAAVRARTRPELILDAAAARPHLTRRALLLELLAAVADGAESPLELRYHRDVEGRHGLPRSARQGWERLGDRWIRSDVRYDGLGVRAELDGRLAHPSGRTEADTWRDNAVVIARAELTLRYRWAHVAGNPCGTARQVAEALRSRGWTGTLRRCGPTCAALP
ncbi:type IV toxin-antitoxin system AbiEi family antitoxin domain-containing protein [Actinotalea fermentans]|uniref:AbiEi antitoxin N-terminal domain-containing protein n=1 Tax=Actinotalea fermentans TaxID=43671 RepID=A0A511YZ28_9CELL|nr:type IV toxin-antitoxin system AbiEi family antitoxin domain-containing protein [Actinotalea fermentans]KGM16866.1 hypothetical protein N867_14730 [Actinotalea fermentans ATCC 43279 = JCM 9966 = DSM 3133]GEN80453.1 hypothetical protein AFE02nite_21870 [Actinotalea fermentans]